MSEQTTEQASVTESYLAELEEAEARAAGLLDGPEGEGLDQRAGALIRHLRTILKQNRKAVDRIRDEARTEARAELVRERQTEAAFRRLSVPPSARALFEDVDKTDERAMARRADELREAGLSWPDMPQPPAPPSPDPSLVQQAMQAAAAGGVTPGSAGDLFTRMQKMADNPGDYTAEEHAAVVEEYNRAVDAAARTNTSGALG